jgi:histidine triad (HIT) family protein
VTVDDAGIGENCLFCAIVHGKAPARVVHEDETTLAFLDINPIVDGHTLIVPKLHSANLLDTSDQRLADVMASAAHVGRLFTERLGCDGVNVLNASGAAAWQTVFHLHLHLLPRYADDGLPFPFTQRFRLGPDERAEREVALDAMQTRLTTD